MSTVTYVLRAAMKRKGRYALGMLALIVTVMMMVAGGVIIAGGQSEFRAQITQAVDYDIIVMGRVTTGAIPVIDSSPVHNATAGDTEVVSVNDILLATATVKRQFSEVAVPLLGAPIDYRRGQVISLDGSEILQPDTVVLSPGAADSANAKVGDNLTFRILAGSVWKEASFTVGGILDVKGRFPDLFDVYAMVEIDSLRSITGEPGKSTLELIVVQQNLYDLANAQDPAGRVLAISDRIATRLGPDYEVIPQKALLLNAAVQGTSFLTTLVYLFSVMFPAVSGMMISSVLTLSVEERAAEIALMRLLGARRKLMARVVAYELMIFIAVGVPVGYFLGYQIPFLLLGDLLKHAEFSLILVTTLQQLFVAIVLLLIFSVRPMLKAFRAMPIDAIRVTNPLETYIQRPRQGIDRRQLAAALMVFVAVAYSTLFIPLLLVLSINTFIIFLLVSVLVMLISLCVVLLGAVPVLQEGFVALLKPFTGEVNKLTRRNLRRYGRRNISTNIIFGTVVAMLVFSNTLLAGVQASGPAAVMFISGADIRVESFIPFSQVELDDVKRVAGVRDLAGASAAVEGSVGALSGAYSRDVSIVGLDGPFAAVSFVADSDVSQGDRQKLNTLGPREVVISQAVAYDLRVELGSTVAVRAGVYKEHVSVGLVMRSIPGFPNLFDESSDFQQGMLVSPSLYENLTGKPAAPTVLFIELDFISNADKVMKELRTVLVSHFALSITSTERELAAIKNTTSLLNLASLGIFSLLLSVAVFALTTNLYASVLERDFETGVLKVLGLRKRTILASFVLEGATIAFTSVTLGVISGVIVGATFIYWLNVISPFDIIVALDPGALLFVYANSIISGILAAYFAARWSVKKEAVQQLVRRF